MSRYQRHYSTGGTYFFTVVTRDRAPVLTDRSVLQALKAAVITEKCRRPFKQSAIVILPDHLHCIWTLPDGDSDFSSRWREIKKSVTRTIQSDRSMWQERFWEHMIRDETDYKNHLDYIYYNPVKHGYVKCVNEWRFSSFHRDVQNGLYDSHWGEVSDAVRKMNFE